MVPSTSLSLFLLMDFLYLASSQWNYSKPTFIVDYSNDQFLKDGKPFTYVAGEMHYFRIPSYYWKDRLEKLKAAGCNTVTTYVEWSFHEPKPGTFYFNGDRDLLRFLRIAKNLHLNVILRPGPYICAEREFGGFPAWLLTKNPDMKLRTSDPSYLRYVEKWFHVLLTQIQPHLHGNGGNIIMVQIENEYGSYPVIDEYYKIWLRDLMKKYIGDAAVLFTTDGPGLVPRGKIPEVYATIDFGPTSEPLEIIYKTHRTIEPKGPLVNSEMYTGWFDYWGRDKAITDIFAINNTIARLMKAKGSFSCYMFHGGTNYGFSAGSGSEDTFLADTTSYDYDAPISEAGDLTPKYMAIRETILKHLNISSNLTIPRAREKGDYGEVKLRPVCSLFCCPIGIEYPPREGAVNFEAFDQAYGFVSYSTLLDTSPLDPSILDADIRDRAIVYLDDVEIATLQYTRITRCPLPSKYKQGQKLRLLIENMGRRNYKRLSDCTKGVVGDVKVDNDNLTFSEIKGYPFSTDDIKVLTELEHTENVSFPAVFRGKFTVPKGKQPLDTFVSMKGWCKGLVFINGKNLGRYWKIGPQLSLYIPKPYLNKYPKVNTLIVCELHCANPCVSVTFVKKPVYLSRYTKTF